MRTHKRNTLKHRILGGLVRSSVRESALQDLDEHFNRIKTSRGKIIAMLWIGIQVLSLIPDLIKDSLSWSSAMFVNHFKIVIRNIRRHKGYSFINMAGLAVGMACVVLILLWIQDELSYDRFHEKGDDIFRIIVEEEEGFRSAGTCPIPLAPRLKQTFPEILESTRFCNGFQDFLVECDGRTFSEEIGIVDPSFLLMFSFSLSMGDPQNALSDPHSVIMTETKARKYFGNQDPMGKTLQVLSSHQEKITFRVAGILEDIPRNSHLQVQLFVPFQIIHKLVWWVKDYEKWGDWSYYTYVLAKKDISIPDVNIKINELVKQNYKGDELTSKFFLQPLADIHLRSDFRYDLAGHGDIRTIRIFAIVALFILAIACANFMNLSTARFHTRSKEVGMRKTIGAKRSQIVRQFMGESTLFVLIAFLAALLFLKSFLFLFNQLTEKSLRLNLTDPRLLLCLVGIFLFTGLLSGCYPAFFLSSFQPSDVLKGFSKTVSKGIFFRKFLVVFQFSLSIIIIICTIVVADQLAFMRNKKLGFDKDHVIHMPLEGIFRQNYDLVRNELLQSPFIEGVAASDKPLVRILRSSMGARLEGKEVCQDIGINFLTADSHLFRTLNMKIFRGRPFSDEFPTDSSRAVIINQTLANALGEENLIGKKLYNYSEGISRQIIDIVEDFHFESLHNLVKPLMIVPRSGSDYKIMYVRIKPDSISSSIQKLKDVWKKYGSGNPFDYHFMDQTIGRFYESEKRIGDIFLDFSILAVFISCLGLFGLASFTAQQRTKEIGIRKVLGASSGNILLNLTKDFSKWILAANVIAWPIAYYSMQKWLQNFAYRINIGFAAFLIAGGTALLIAYLTVSYQSIRSALANPVESLRYE